MIAFSLAVLFGLGWGFGLAASGTASKEATFVFQLLFTIFVGCQGVLIFILHGIRKEEARNEWKKWFSTTTGRTHTLYSHAAKSASTAPSSQHIKSQPTSPSYEMHTLPISGTIPSEVPSETHFKASIDVEMGEIPSETQKIESTEISGQGAPRKRSLIQAAVESIKFPGKHGRYDVLKPSETPPPQRERALHSVTEAPGNTMEDGSEDEMEAEIIEGLPDVSAPSRQVHKPHRSWLSPFKERSEKYDLVSHDSPPPIHAERNKKEQSSCTLAKNLHEHEDEEKEEEQAKPLPHDTTAAADCHA